MLRLKTGRRAVLVETLRELANLVAGALVLGQLVGQQPSSLWVIFGGVAAWLVLVAVAIQLAGEDQ